MCVNTRVLLRFGRSSTWILLTHLVETWSQGGKNGKRSPCILVWTENPHTLRIDDAITPPPRPLNPAPSHNNNNNNGELHASVRAAKDIEPIMVTRQNIMLLCHYAEWKRIMDNRLAIFAFLFCSVSHSTVCLYTVRMLYAHAPSLLLLFGWISISPP